ncbi:MAG: DUF1932 domain-containing protein [Dinoroseobacter sp.]|nr:DUF1932 domain-containing protein [Dinoroseobacter sp.]
MKIAFIGMGEAGSALVKGWGAARAPQITAYDIKSDVPDTAPEIAARCAALGIERALSPADALSGAELVFSTVTADQALSAAQSGAPHLASGAVWCDLNSCAPGTKRRAAAVIEEAGGRYLDVAVMAPVYPGMNMVPLLISGPHAADLEPVLAELPMAPKRVEGDVGRASSIKMIRSVMVKGMEALTAECVLAARAAGVEAEVLASLQRSHPGIKWEAKSVYNLERMLVHGVRRAAEMEEVAKTLAELDLPNALVQATVDWQRRIAATSVAPPAETDPIGPVADDLLAALKAR